MSPPEATVTGYPLPLGFSVNQGLALRMANSSPEFLWDYGLRKLCSGMKLAPAKGEVNGTLVLRGLHTAKYLKNPCTKKSSGGPARETYKISDEGSGVLAEIAAASGWMLDKIPDDHDCAPAEDFKDLGNMKLGALAILISGMEEEGTYASKIFTRFFEGSGTEITGKPSSGVMRNLNTAKLFSDPTIVEVDNAPDRNIYRTTRLGGRVLALAVPPLEMLAGEKKQQLSVLNQ